MSGNNAEPGRGLDSQIAELLFRAKAETANGTILPPGTRLYPDNNPTGWAYRSNNVPHYSTRIEDAWKLVEHLRTLPDVGLIIKAFPVGRDATYTASIPGTDISTWADTAPLAISRAVLKVVEANEMP